MKIKKYIPRAIGGVCLLTIAITALILIPPLTTLLDFQHFDSLQLLELNGQQL